MQRTAVAIPAAKAQRMTSRNLGGHFEELFSQKPKVFRAPGRVNLIGEHTDYNDGFVLPMAISFSTRVAVAPRADHKLIIRSEDFPEHFEFDAERLPQQRTGSWCDYVLGLAWVLEQVGCPIPGASLLIRGDVPIGAGLSSSAAIEVASALALMSLNGAIFPMRQVAKLCQRAENVFIGAHVGIMDQFISCLGRAGHALWLDCRSLDFQLVPIPARVCLVVCNTMVKHEHAAGEYNRRRQECEEGVKLLAKWYPNVRALRDVSPAQLRQHVAEMPDTVYRRCLHVVEEDERVSQCAQAFDESDLNRVGQLMLASHRSLRDLYEVSCRELDTMVDAANGLPGYHGGRMTGGGFGGCTVNVVDADQAQDFATRITERYHKATGVVPEVYICSAEDGAGLDS
jgi:galactokinase